MRDDDLRRIALGMSGAVEGAHMGHLVGSVYFERWLPATTSAPLLLAASTLLAYFTAQRLGPGSRQRTLRSGRPFL